MRETIQQVIFNLNAIHSNQSETHPIIEQEIDVLSKEARYNLHNELLGMIQAIDEKDRQERVSKEYENFSV